ncbi:ATP-binding protein [Streptomyces sp. NPDC020917]|uniref:ATP-binding protein n=1 Tax=Streptomyces sp. NPDC020917 TaxID=3365102 RepID=UPI0037BCF2CC
MTSSSRFHSRLDLASVQSAPRWARLHARGVFATWEIAPAAADDAVLVVSELVTNAVRHATALPAASDQENGPTRVCALTLQCMLDHLLICVHDQDRHPPVLKAAATDGESGRGLHLIDELSFAWGYTYPNPSGGKAVWAKIATAENTELHPSPHSRQAPFVSGPR